MSLDGSRSVEEVLLSHDVRREIHELIQEEPGLHIEGIARRLDLDGRIVNHHIQRLVRHGLLERIQPGQAVLLFPPDREELWSDERTQVLFARRAVREVAMYLLEHEGATSEEIAEATGRSTDTARSHLRVLREHELATTLRSGHETYYFPEEPLEHWAELVEEG